MTNIRRNYSNTAAQTTTSSTMSASSTSFTVASASNYPVAPFTVRVENEIVLVGGTTGTTFNTLTRGYDDTVAATHASGVAVEHRAIAADFRHKWLDPVVWDDAVTAYDDEMDDTDMSAWSQVTPAGTANWTKARGVMSVVFENQLGSDCAANLTSLNGLSFPLYVVTACRNLTFNRNNTMFGPVFSDGTTSTSGAVWFRNWVDTGNGYVRQSLYSGTLTSMTTNVVTPASVSKFESGWSWYRLDWVSPNTWRFWGSPDAVSWSDMGVNSNLSSTLTPTHYGLGVSTNGDVGGYPRVVTWDTFRVYAAKPSYWQEL